MVKKTMRELVQEYNKIAEEFGPYSFTAHEFLLDHEDDKVLNEIARLHRTTLRTILGEKRVPIEDEALFLEDTPGLANITKAAWPIKLLQYCYVGVPKPCPKKFTQYAKQTGKHGCYSAEARKYLDDNINVPNFQKWALAHRLNDRCRKEIVGEQISACDQELYTRDTPLAQKIIEELRKFKDTV